MADLSEHDRIQAAADLLDQMDHADLDTAIARGLPFNLAEWLRHEAATFAEYPASDGSPSTHALAFADALLNHRR
jgi:hypothetical protein